MDLPTCPACGQSVLDEDAADCPFCGASMSGKPQAKRPTTPAAPPKTSPAASTAQQTPTKSAEPVVDSNDEQDPFAVDSTADTKKAIPLRTQPEKGRSHEVICPMCETPGYTSTKAAGRDVRCCNVECLVRVFTAPELPQEAPVEIPQRSRHPAALMAAGGILAVALVAGGVWYFVFRPPELTTIDGQLYDFSKHGGNNTPGDDTTPPPTVPSKNNEPKSPREIQAATLRKMADACLQRDNNRSKPYCRRVTAVALARAGDVAASQKQLEQMRSLRPAIPYYEIEPLVAIAWNAHRSGDSAAMKRAIDAAAKAATQLPKRGRSRLTDAVDLAAILVVAGRIPEAKALIAKHEEANLEGQLAAEFSAMRATQQFNADAFVADTPVAGWGAPQTVAVVIALVARGEDKSALAWAASQQDVAVHSEATIVWADTILKRTLAGGSEVDLTAVETAANGLPTAGKARLYARLASRFQMAERPADATMMLAKARTDLSKLSPPSAVELPGMKELVTFQLPPTAPIRMAALAAAEIAAAESRAGNSEKSTAAFELSMQFLRGSAPSPLAIQRRLNAIDDFGVKAMRAEIKSALKLRTDEEARLTFNDYRKNCTDIASASQRRFALQESVLISMVRVGLADQVLSEVITRSEHPDPDLREPWTKTDVPWRLVDIYGSNDDADAAGKIQALLEAAGARRPRIDDIVMRAEKQFADGNYKQAAAEFETRASAQVSDDLRDQWRLRLAGRLTAKNKLRAAFDFVSVIRNSDASFREMALWFISAQATQSGLTTEVWEIGQHPSWTATELVSIYGGLNEAILVPQPPETAATN